MIWRVRNASFQSASDVGKESHKDHTFRNIEGVLKDREKPCRDRQDSKRKEEYPTKAARPLEEVL
jgi:hypothetical protein